MRPRRGHRPLHLECDHGLGLALQLEAAPVAEAEESLDETGRLGTGEHRPRRGLRLEPCRDVDRVADGAVLDPAAGADRSDDDGAGVHAHPDAEAADAEAPLHLEGIRPQLVRDLQRGAQRAFRIVFVRRRRTEQREHAVARQILDGAAEVLDGVHHPGHGVADDEPYLLGIELLAERGRTDEVGRERRDDSAFFAHGRLPRHASYCAVRGTRVTKDAVAAYKERRCWESSPCRL